MIGVLPEIVDLAVDDAWRGDAVLGLGDLQGVSVENGVARIFLQHVQGLGVLDVDPVHGLFAVGVFEPEVGIVLIRWLRMNHAGQRGE